MHIVFDTISYGYLSVGKDCYINEHNQKHLTLSNRSYIEQELLQKSTFSSIGNNLHKDPSTISKEVKRYSKTVPAKYSYKCNRCKHYNDCDLMSKELNDLVSPLILKGQPLSHIFAVHADEIPVCRRTLYNYLDQRVFQARNIDLPAFCLLLSPFVYCEILFYKSHSHSIMRSVFCGVIFLFELYVV